MRESRACLCHFRAHQSAAPLKLSIIEANDLVWVLGFPRSPERGPIEASRRMRFCSSSGRFPRSPERGPIEAQEGATGTGSDGKFPRSPERGPIEALSCYG